MSSDRGVYSQYHHAKMGVQVAYNYGIAVNHVSNPFLQDISLSIKFCVTPYGMTNTVNKTNLLNDTSIIGKGIFSSRSQMGYKLPDV